MTLKENGKGFLFTIAAIMLIVPLIYLIAFYGRVGETQMDDTVGKIRCDELHYYVEDVKKDTARAITVFGRRAAMLAIDDILQKESSLGDYEFQCSPNCKVNCSNFEHPKNGSEAAIAELIACGTLYGNNVSSMVNHTLVKWKDKMIDEGELMHFNVNITPFAIDVVPVDSWHFAVILQNKISVSDKEGLCYYSQNVVTSIANTSIIGLEDPMYMLKNMERKYIQNCSPENALPTIVAGCGGAGTGSGGGYSVLYSSDISNMADYRAYCKGTTDTAPSNNEITNQVFLLNTAKGLLCAGSGMPECFNISSPRHFSAIISYKSDDIPECSNIPVIVDTGDLDQVNPNNYGDAPDPTCFGGRYISSGDCVYIINDNDCTPAVHYVLFGYSSKDLNTSCYYVSDINETGSYNDQCDLEKYPNGPSFFDRLDGNLNLSQKYVDQSVKYFNNRLIGMESFVDLYNLYFLKNQGYDVDVNTTRTWVDYLYWQSKPGCAVSGYCEMNDFSVRSDCPHAYKYGLVTGCSTGSICNKGGACVAGCPKSAQLSGCRWDESANNWRINYTLQVSNCFGSPIDINPAPQLKVVSGGTSTYTYKMKNISVGVFINRTTDRFPRANSINGTVTITKGTCSPVSGESYYTKLAQGGDLMPECP